MKVLLDLNRDALMVCLEFLSFEDIEAFETAVELSSNHHNQLFESMKYAIINNDFDQPIDILFFRSLRFRGLCPTRFHFDGDDDITTWQVELERIDKSVFNPLRNVEHINFDRLLARPIGEVIDRGEIVRIHNRSLCFITSDR